ncbi:MAG: flagellin [Thermanaerothrix sp.]|jgi:flagellar hook-associated protein 3 FlgL|uniref:Flagellin n=1 Tax=Thermanaerothrix solaris TaxID=3058434 RepID=A0ABU3NLG1_9CHLR|nr:flagellin [Thermanaerothrix sp. 4228-RoL]MDT8897671.1 hypothetical protein [Thermanaerothrix sp. 4228-RoL]
MRITQNMMTQNAIRHLEINRERIADFQMQIASGKQYQVVSDNPGLATQAMLLRSQTGMVQTYLDIAQAADDWFSANELALSQLVNLGSRALTLGYNGVSDTQGEQERRTFADEVDSLIRQAIDLGNSSHKDNYLFSGHRILTRPFTLLDPNTVIYNGDQEQIQVKTSPDTSTTLNINGDVLKPFFEALIELRNALQSEPFDRARLINAIGDLTTQLETLKTARSANGARQRQIRAQIDFLGQAQAELKALLSQKEDVNIAEAISMLRSQETTYQATLEVTRRAISVTSLFDLLR